jgi:hypothetical protein
MPYEPASHDASSKDGWLVRFGIDHCEPSFTSGVKEPLIRCEGYQFVATGYRRGLQGEQNGQMNGVGCMDRALSGLPGGRQSQRLLDE